MASTTNIARQDRQFVTGKAETAVVHPVAKPVLLIGGWCGIIGALLALVANSLHPHPSDFHLEALLQEVAQSSTWTSVHLTLIFGLVLILAAMLAMTMTFEQEPGATIGRFACMAALLGGALILVSTSMDGFAKNHVARAWFDAAPADRMVAFRISEALEYSQYAIYSLSVALFLGLGIFLYGLATVLSNSYPRLLGWLAMVSGAGAFVVGVIQALAGLEFRGTEIFFVIFSMLSTVWIFIAGVIMARRYRQAISASPVTRAGLS